MNKLVVLVGLPGSGKTSFRSRHPDWAVISKDDIRRTIFHRDFDPEFEDAVDRIFGAALVEAVDSPASVVCVDNTNITRAERAPLLEVAQLSGRVPIAYIMPQLPMEVMYARKLRQLNDLARAHPDIVVSGFPAKRYEMMYHLYEEVSEDEGFARVFREVEPIPMPKRTRRRRARKVRTLDPLPLFVS